MGYFTNRANLRGGAYIDAVGREKITRRKRVDVEEAHGIGERVLDEHALRVVGDEFFGGGFCVVGEQDGGLVSF